MNEWSVFLAGVGLVLDIVGVCFLFVTTSARRVEAEMVSKAMSEITDEKSYCQMLWIGDLRRT